MDRVEPFVVAGLDPLRLQPAEDQPAHDQVVRVPADQQVALAAAPRRTLTVTGGWWTA
jgi:hypothetical protein